VWWCPLLSHSPPLCPSQTQCFPRNWTRQPSHSFVFAPIVIHCPIVLRCSLHFSFHRHNTAMLQSYPVLAPSPQMGSRTLSPLRTKRRLDHERHGSEVLQRPRPMSATAYPAMQHSKRASIYVSDASIILAQRASMTSPTSPSQSPSNETLHVDHYAILELDPQANTDDIKAAYRRLRAVYFQSDAKKYRALQAAFDTLLDPEARQAYDATCAAHPSSSPSGTADAVEPKHGRKDSATGTEGGIATVSEEGEDMRDDDGPHHDPNWALKRHQRRRSHVIGTQHYWSHIPISTRYHSTDTNPLACGRPAYLGHFAVMAFPN